MNPIEHLTSGAESGKCDFCSEPMVLLLDLPDFMISPRIRSTENWAVCEACSALVKERKKRELLDRAVASTRRLVPEMAALSTSAVRSRIWQLHDMFWQLYDPPKTPLPLPWVEAYQRQLEAKTNLQHFQVRGANIRRMVDAGLSNDPGFGEEFTNSMLRDLRILEVCQTYAFHGDALDAILEASRSIPLDSMLQAEQIPGNGQGFWWFRPALPWPCTQFSDYTNGLLWGITSPYFHGNSNSLIIPAGSSMDLIDMLLNGKGYAIYISAYVMANVNNKAGDPPGSPAPATSFRWHLGETIGQLLERTSKEYEATYGKDTSPSEFLMGIERHLESIMAMAQFFLASCVWVHQEIVEIAPGHVERHDRKRLAKKHGVEKLPELKVISLRRRHREQIESTVDGPSTGRGWKLTHRVVVPGHWRNQAYGPGRTGRKLIRIMPHVRGAGFEARPTRPTVFSVVR